MRDEQFSSKPRSLTDDRRTDGQTPARFTRFTAERPAVISKSFALGGDGKPSVTNGGMMSSGRCMTVEVENLTEFAKVIKNLGTSQALGYGVCEHSPARVVPQNVLERVRRGAEEFAVARTAETFLYPSGPAIMMFDYDPPEGGPVLTREQIVQLSRDVFPELAQCQMLWVPSASSHIFHGKQELRGLSGQRLYLIVEEGTDISRSAAVLTNRLWLAAYGYIKISSAGSLLLRTPFDGSVYQPNRLDFAAGAHCQSPLEQHRGDPVLIPGLKPRLDSRVAFPDLTPEECGRARARQESAKAEKRYQAEQVRSAWLDRRVADTAGPHAGPEEQQKIRKNLEEAVEQRILSGTFALPVVMAPGEVEWVPVSKILKDPARYDGKLTRDPFEPDYDGGRPVGKLYLAGRKKVLHSFARGETTYELRDERIRIDVSTGQIGAAVDEVLVHLRNAPDIFDRGGDLVIVENGGLHVFDGPSLQQELDRRFSFWRALKSGMQDVDAPDGLAKRILSQGKSRQLKPLSALITAPTLRLDGTLLAVPGYDDRTAVYLCSYEGWEVFALPERITLEEIRFSLTTLMAPFAGFPFATAVDRSVHSAALLTAVIRPLLPTAPAFGYDAPVQGSGKTLLARCVGALATGREPAVMPMSARMDDEEIRKRALAMLRGGTSVMVWDNIMGQFNSPAAAMMLTSATYTDRILGRSEAVTFDMRSMLILTGNNLSLTEDMVRRVFVCRIDPGQEQPFNRRFACDPYRVICEEQVELIRCALIILRGYQQIGRDVRQGRLASFEDWSDVVGAAMAWIAEDVEPERYADPVQALRQAEDPRQQELSELLRVLRHAFGDREFKAKDVAELGSQKGMSTLRDSGVDVHEFAALFGGLQGTLSSFSVASYLRNRKDRIAGGRRLVSRPDRHAGSQLWRVEEIE